MADRQRQAGIERYLVPVLIGFAPVAMLVMTWSYDAKEYLIVQLIRGYALPVLAVELAVITVAFMEGLGSALRDWWRSPWIWAPLLAIFAILFGNALLVAPNPPIAWVRAILLLVHLLFGAAIAWLWAGQVGERRIIAFALIGFLAFCAGSALFLAGVDNWRAFDWVNGFAGASHIRHLGYYCAAIGGLAIGAIIAGGRSGLHWLGLVALILAVGFAFWTGSRGATVALACGYVVTLLLFRSARRVPAVALCLGGFAIGLIGASLLPEAGSNMGVTRTVTALAGQSDAGFTSLRTIIWRQSAEAILANPLFGYGAGQVNQLTTWPNIGHPHSLVFQVPLAVGLIGTALLGIIAIPFFWRALRHSLADQAMALPFFVTLIVLGGYSLVDGTLYHTIPLCFFALSAGILAAQMRAAHRRPDKGEQDSG